MQVHLFYWSKFENQKGQQKYKMHRNQFLINHIEHAQVQTLCPQSYPHNLNTKTKNKTTQQNECEKKLIMH